MEYKRDRRRILGLFLHTRKKYDKIISKELEIEFKVIKKGIQAIVPAFMNLFCKFEDDPMSKDCRIWTYLGSPE